MLQHPRPPPLITDPRCHYIRCSPRHHRRGRRHERRSRRRRGSWHGPPSPHRGGSRNASAARARRRRLADDRVASIVGTSAPAESAASSARSWSSANLQCGNRERGVGLGCEVMTRRCGRGAPVLGEAGGEEGEGVGDALLLRRRHDGDGGEGLEGLK
jgi:hypothetical protein